MGNKASTRSRLKLIYFILIALSSGVSTFSFGQITDNITTVNAPQSQSLVVDYLGEGAGASTLLGFFYLDIDTDKDGIPDFYETAPGDDLDGDGLINAADPDDDNDGILDGVDTAPAVTSIPASYFANGTVASANGSTPGDYWQFLPNSTIAAGTYAGYYEHPGAYLYIDNNANNVPDVLEYTSNNMPPFPVEKDFAATHPILGEFNGLLGDWDYSGSPGATPSERTHTTGKTIYYICDDDFGASQTGNYAASPYFPTYIDSYSSVNSEIDYNIYGTTDPLSTEIPGSIIGLDPAGVDFYKYRWFDELIVSPNRELVFFTSVFWNTGGSQVNTYYSRQEFNPDNAATYPTVNGSTTGDNYGGGTTTNWYPELQNTADHNSLAADVFGGGTTWASIASSPIDGTSPIAILAGDQPWVDMYENWTTDKRIIQYRDVDDCMNATAAGINTVIDDRYGYDLTTDGKDIIIRAKDGKQAHFMIIEPTGDPNSLIIGVEDLYSGGDRDFEDEVFYVTLFDGVSITTTKTDNFTVNQCTDTIQYEVVIKNFGVTTATAVTFDDTPDANTTLEVGSVSTSVGAVTSGNTGGDTDVQVAVGSLALGDSVIIFFNVSVNPGVFPTTTLVSNQGTVSGGNFTSILTGDPDSTDHFIATGTDLSVMIDSVAPIITCPVDLAVDLDVDCEYVLIDYTGLATATDNCVSPVPLTQSPIVGTVITTTTTITIIADDGNGNIDSCSFDIIPADNALPTMVCQDINAYLDGSGNVSITATDINGGTTDNCGIATLVTSETDFICGDIGANNVTLIGTDVNGNIDSCIAVVTVLDTISPAPICQDITVFLDGLGNITFTAADIDGGSSDNCTSITLTASATTFTCAETGMNDVTLIVTDDSGNIDSCVAVVTVVDTTNATVICQNIDVFLDAAGDVSIIGSDIDGGSTDNCGIATLVPSITDFTCAETGANNVTLVVTDNSGNSDSCIAIVTVLDTISPIVNCLDINAFLDITGNVSISASDVDDASTDNCGIATLTISVTDFDCTDIGINTITLVVIDDHGNSDSCEATITIQDTINPTVICDDITVFLDATGNAVITASDIDGGSTDECGIGIIAASTLAFTCAEIGANNVSLYVIDNNGNLDSCLAIVTILDSLNLAVVCQDIDLYLDALGAGSITPADIDNGSSDECGIATMLTSEIDFNCADVGTNDVTLIVTDNNGNVDSCTAIVTVIDSVAPNVICQDIAIYLDATGNISIDDADIDGGATDNCGIFSIVASETTFDCSNIGLNNITLVVTDNAGLADSCIAVVTVLDTINPDVICENINAYLDEFGNVSFTVADLDGGSSDACGIDVSMASEDSFTCADIGANNVTVIVTDINGNIDSCIAVVTVIDTIAPNVICQNLTIYLDETGNAGISATDLDDGSSDACSPLTLTASQTDFICNDAGINNITLYVADDYANIDSCIAIVTVLDTIPPTIICEGDHEEYLDEDCQFIVPDYIITTSFDDNCSELEDFIITQTPLVGEVLVGTNDEFVITLTVEDESGNISSCNFTITLIDNTPPAIECIDDQAIETDFSCVYEIGDYTNLVTAELDNCDLDNVTITQFPEPGSFVTAESDVFGESNQGQTIVTIVIEDLSGNKDSCEFIIDVTCFSEIEIPQLISPNGDGKNDLLIIDWIEQYPENELIVFNRWGNIVYKASPYENDWNGESNMITIGNEVPDGSYFYQFVASPNSEVITGYIIIKR